MPNVTAPTRQMANGDVITQFVDSVDTAAVTYTYPKTQERFKLRNIGQQSLSVTVSGTTQTVISGGKWEIVADFTSFSINAVSGSTAFDAWADEKGSNFDSAEGIASLYDLAVRTSKSRNFGYNLDAGLRVIRSAIADIDRNPAIIAVVGDSVAYGAYSSDIMNKNWVSRLRKSLQAKLGDVGVGNYPIPADSTAPQLALSPWQMVGTWTYTNAASVFGRRMQATGNTNTATLVFTGTSIDLVYRKDSSGASSGVSITIDSVAQTVPNFNGATSVGNVQSYTGLSTGSHTLVITAPASGNVYVEGVIAYNPIATTPKGCYVLNMSNPGATSTYFNNYTFQITVVAKNPHLIILPIAINDARLIPDQHYATMKQMIQGFQTYHASTTNSPPSILLMPYCMNDNPTNLANYMKIIQQQYQLADELNCGLIDIFARWNTFNEAVSIGFMGSSSGLYDGSVGSDIYHPSDKGHRDIANILSLHLIGQVT